MIFSNRVLVAVSKVALLAGSAYAESQYIWPNTKTDLLETMLYEQTGYRSGMSPASFIVPCNRVIFGTGRNGAAEWLRTAYHDMATADAEAGTGGIDASIGYELDRDENIGIGFNETLANLACLFTSRSSMADLIAMGALFAANGCSNGKVDIPYRMGRVDATGPGPTGVPRPEQPLDEHVASFKQQGFTQEEMIGLVACGHTLGGVHGVDFPEIVDVVNDTAKDDNTQTFDTTNTGMNAFDNTVAVQYVQNNTQNPLAFGHNVTTNSDARIFGSDGGKLIQQMATSPDFFYKTCTSLLERMINTVPKAVTLSEPIVPIPLKPARLFATINNDGTMTLLGDIRVIGSADGDRNSRSLNIHVLPRSGEDCIKTKSCVVGKSLTNVFSSKMFYGDDPLTFWIYSFEAVVPVSQGISGFYVEVIDEVDGVTTSTMYNNGGNGFPFDDTILTQRDLSCSELSYVGLMNVTVAIRDDARLDSLKALVHVPEPLLSLTPRVGSIPLDFAKVGVVEGSGYTLYNASIATGTIPYNSKTNQAGVYLRTYDLLGSNATHTLTSEFNMMDGLYPCPNPALGF